MPQLGAGEPGPDHAAEAIVIDAVVGEAGVGQRLARRRQRVQHRRLLAGGELRLEQAAAIEVDHGAADPLVQRRVAGVDPRRLVDPDPALAAAGPRERRRHRVAQRANQPHPGDGDRRRWNAHDGGKSTEGASP